MASSSMTGVAAALEYGQLVLGEQRLQQLLFSELRLGRYILDLFGIQLSG